jgi:hypothetical protein
MIHELLLSPTETGSGSHPCCVVSVTYHRPSYFHGANAGSNPAGDANSISYGRIVYSLFNYWTRNRAVTCGPSALVTCEDCAGVGCDCAQIGTPIGSLAMLTLREDAASIEDSFRHQTRTATKARSSIRKQSSAAIARLVLTSRLLTSNRLIIACAFSGSSPRNAAQP